MFQVKLGQSGRVPTYMLQNKSRTKSAKATKLFWKRRADLTSVCHPKSLVGLKTYISKTSLDLESSALAPLSHIGPTATSRKTYTKDLCASIQEMFINIRLFLVLIT